jgi:uncharacterized protein YjbI with pentapeptide repeats
VEQEQKPRERSFIRALVPDWRPTREQVLWTIRIMLVLVVLLGILTLVGLPFDITLWDWLDLLIIPVVLAIGGYLFTRSENRATRAAAEQRAQDEALQAYLDQMSQLLTDKERPLHEAQQGDSLSVVARARTRTVLTRLDGERKGSVVRFLHESGLITKDRTIVDLKGADLRGADLHEASLGGADLHEASLGGADLRGAYLGRAELEETDLSQVLSNGATFLGSANLYKAKMSGMNLSGANVNEAELMGANLTGANLRRTYLNQAHLNGADLSGADLDETRLFKADLTNAIVTDEQLAKCKSLEDATMPDGQILKSADNPDGPTLEEWLKNKGRGEDGENE